MKLSGWIVLAASLSVASCDRTGPSVLPSPSPIPQPQPAQVRLSGSVYDSAFRPVAEARVEIVEGPHTGLTITTNAQGGYFFLGNFDDTTRVRATKEGHVEATESMSPSCPTCSPNTRYAWFYLAVAAAPVNIAGDYTLTFAADSACTGVPEGVRTRTYRVRISSSPNPRNPADTTFSVTALGVPMVGGHASFPLGVAGNFVAFQFGDHGPYMVEEVDTNTYVAFDGRAEALLEASPPSSLAITFHGWANYCHSGEPMSQYYDCRPAPGTVRVSCESRAHQLILTR